MKKFKAITEEVIPTIQFGKRMYRVEIEGEVNDEDMKENLAAAIAHTNNTVAEQIMRDIKDGGVAVGGPDVVPEHTPIPKPPSQEQQAPSGGQPAPQQAPSGGDMASEKQQKLVYAKLKGLGYDNNKIKEFLLKFAGVDSTKNLKWKQINDLVKKIDEIKASREPEKVNEDPFN